MIKLCLAHAMGASAIAFTILPMAGCIGRSTAESQGVAYLAAAPLVAVPGDEMPLARDGGSAARSIDSEAEPMMPPTLIELHHFNAYQKFRAMQDKTSDAHRGNARGGETIRSAAPETSGDSGYSACSSDSLIKQD